jgi:TolB-like protein
MVFDIDNQTGSDSLEPVARTLTTALRTAIAQRLGASVAADSESEATRDAMERRAVAVRLGAGALVAGTIYRARDDMVTIRLSIRDMSDHRTFRDVDVRVPRNAVAEQIGPVIDAVIARLGQANWGPKQGR